MRGDPAAQSCLAQNELTAQRQRRKTTRHAVKGTNGRKKNREEIHTKSDEKAAAKDKEPSDSQKRGRRGLELRPESQAYTQAVLVVKVGRKEKCPSIGN